MNTENPSHGHNTTAPHNTAKWIEEVFNFQPPTDTQIPKYTKLREAAKNFAATLVELTPVGPDQSAALRKIREAVMTANAAIALDGKSFV